MGWIKLDRAITEHDLWGEKPFSYGQAWVDLLLLANHKDGKMLYKKRMIKTKRGDVNRSILWLANRWGWSRHKARDFLNLLSAEEMIRVNATTHMTTITIVNYTLYQDSATTTGQQKDNKRTTKGHIQEGKEGKESIILKNNTYRPTLTDIERFVEENGFAVSASEFYDYYTSQGWKKGNGMPVKDWRACVRSWNRKAMKEADAIMEKHEARQKRLAELREQERSEIEEMNRKAEAFRKGMQ